MSPSNEEKGLIVEHESSNVPSTIDQDQEPDAVSQSSGSIDHAGDKRSSSSTTSESSKSVQEAGKNWKRIMANRRSAFESRQRRRERLAFLEKAYSVLRKENENLVRENAGLRNQVSSLMPLVETTSRRLPNHENLPMTTRMVPAPKVGPGYLPPPSYPPSRSFGLPPPRPYHYHHPGNHPVPPPPPMDHRYNYHIEEDQRLQAMLWKRMK